MSFNPFQARLQELEEEKTKKIPETAKVEDVTSLQKQDPFKKRLEQKTEISESLWNGFYDMIFSPEETAFEKGLGSSIRSMGTAIGGFPGDVIKIIKGTSDWVEKKMPTPSLLKREPTIIQDIGKQVLDKAPTTQELMDKYDKLTQGKYIPQNEKEALLQEMGGDIALLLLPATTIGKAGKAIAAGIMGNLASEGLKNLEYGEGVQAAGKIGTMMIISTFNPGGALKFSEDLYQQAYANLPENAVISAKTFKTGLDNLKTDLKKGLVNVESKKPVLNAINDVERNIKEGNVNIRDLTEAKRNLNEQRAAKIYDPEFKGGKQAKKQLKINYGKLAHVIDETIEDYGKTNEPFFKPYKEANQAWGGIEQSRKASQFMIRTIKNYKLATSLGALVGILKIPGIGVSGVTAGYGTLKSYELMHRIMMNPILRKHYMNAVLEASKESAPGVINNLKKMDKELKKTDEQI